MTRIWDEPGTVLVGPRPTGEPLVLDGAFSDLQQIRVLLERLVALEEARLAREQWMETFITQRSQQDEAPPLPTWFVRGDGSFGITEIDGTQRPATAEESARIAATIKPSKRDR